MPLLGLNFILFASVTCLNKDKYIVSGSDIKQKACAKVISSNPFLYRSISRHILGGEFSRLAFVSFVTQYKILKVPVDTKNT